MNRYIIDGYVRITKKTARNLFNEGKQFYIQSCNIRPINPWQPATVFDPKFIEEGMTFTALVNAFEYYNCDSKRGRYAAFYTDCAGIGR